MFKNYFKIALRNIWKSKAYALINILGLSVAFCVSVFLLLSAYFQLSFDRFNNDLDRIYQTYFFANDPEKPDRAGAMPLPLTPALVSEFSEVEAITRVLNGGNVVEYKGKFLDKNLKFVDPQIFSVFTFPLVKGNAQSALADLNNIVITEDMAAAVFGQEDPMGKILTLGIDAGRRQYVVTGVLKDLPDNSTIRTDAFVRVETLQEYPSQKNQWDAHSHPVFLKLKTGVSQEAFEVKLRQFSKKYFPANFENLAKKGAKPDERGDIFAVRLQKMADVHFDREISGRSGAPVALIYAVIGIAVFILLIACINFINLNVARSFIRAREIGVRKSLGALKKQLFVQIWGEAAVICLAGLIAGYILTALSLPAFNAVFQSRLTLEYMFQPGQLLMVASIFVVVTLLAGGYPAWQMSRFNAVEVLKGKVSLKKPGFLRNSLIVTQFSLSCLLICCTVIAIQQVDHLRQQPLGFQKEEVISIPVGSKVNGKLALQRMRDKLASDPSVVALTGSGVNLGMGKDRSSSRSVIGFTFKDRDVSTDWLMIDYDYLKTLNIKLLEGREFNPAYPTDSVNRVIITESMAKMIGETEPVGKFFETDTAGAKYQIIGLVPDFNLYSNKTEKKPVTMHLGGNAESPSYIFVRMAPGNLANGMEKLKAVWKEVAPGVEFNGSFMDENTNNWYNDEERLSRMFSLAAGVAILLSCLGLFAVALIMMEQRTKEIGVRKVLGASIPGLVYVLSRDFVKLVLVAMLIATPLAWLFMDKWLEGYSYRVRISPLVFLTVGAAAVMVTLLTVGFQSIKAALMNPTQSLRSE